MNVVTSTVNVAADREESSLAVVSVDASLPVDAILAQLPIHELGDETLLSVLEYVSKRDAITDYSIYYGALVNAMVRSKYSQDEVEAILSNIFASDWNDENKAEAVEFQAYRKDCKKRAKTIVDMMSE